ncbi:MAG TPA: hypothetical protein DDZ44_04875, partial [Syntrophomonas wolfei]|nr:hypothetical protein [Syntrophomonas wolfei]
MSGNMYPKSRRNDKMQVGQYAEITSGACRNIIGQIVQIDRAYTALQVDATTIVIASNEDVGPVSWAKKRLIDTQSRDDQISLFPDTEAM